jgi:hypothetical protein
MATSDNSGFRLTVSCMKDDSLMDCTLSVGIQSTSGRNLRNSGTLARSREEDAAGGEHACGF